MTETTPNPYWAGHNDAMEKAAAFFEKMHSNGPPLAKFNGKFVATQLRGMKAILDEHGNKLISDFGGQDLNHCGRSNMG